MAWIELNELVRNRFIAEPLAIEGGGTGAGVAAEARKNLEIADITVSEDKTYTSDTYNKIKLGTGESMYLEHGLSNNELSITAHSSAEDYIVEKGYRGGWFFRRWASGWAECIKTNSYSNIVINKQWENGSLYYSTAFANITEYPIRFTEPPQLFFNSRGSKTTIPLPDGYGTVTKPPNVYFYTGALKDTEIDLQLDIRAEGWWKE